MFSLESSSSESPLLSIFSIYFSFFSAASGIYRMELDDLVFYFLLFWSFYVGTAMGELRIY